MDAIDMLRIWAKQNGGLVIVDTIEEDFANVKIIRDTNFADGFEASRDLDAVMQTRGHQALECVRPSTNAAAAVLCDQLGIAK